MAWILSNKKKTTNVQEKSMDAEDAEIIEEWKR
jgi:hypothetical protein